MNKIPAALIPRFEAFKDILKVFKTYHDFHNAFPSVRLLNGELCTQETPELPVIGQASLEQLVQTVLLPLYEGKRLSSLFGSSSLPALQATC